MANRFSTRMPGRRSSAVGSSGVPQEWDRDPTLEDDRPIDLQRRYEQLGARVAELQWDLGGLVYEMAVRDRIHVDVLVRRAAELQEADAELSEVERILLVEQTGTAGACGSCGAPHSSGAVYCWQCGQPLLAQLPADSVSAASAS